LHNSYGRAIWRRVTVQTAGGNGVTQSGGHVELDLPMNRAFAEHRDHLAIVKLVTSTPLRFRPRQKLIDSHLLRQHLRTVYIASPRPERHNRPLTALAAQGFPS
jgi:hypothetical protein